MARLFSLGAEEGSRRAMMDLVSLGSITDANVQVVDVNNPVAVTPRTGDFCYPCLNGAGYFQANLPVGLAELYGGFAFYPANNTSSSNFLQHVLADCGMDLSSGLLRIKRSSTVLATAPLNINAWNYIEFWFKPLDASGRWTVKINGSQVIDYTGDNNNGTADAGGGIQFHGLNVGASSYYAYYDDIVLNSVAGANNNSWPGQARLFPLRVRGAGDVQQMSRKGVDLGSNAAQVREVGSGIAWLEGVDVDEYELAAADAPTLPAGATISNVIAEIHARTQTGSTSIKPMIKSNTTEAEGAAQPLNTSWGGYQQVWNTDPATSAAWTLNALATLQLGAKIA